MKIKTVISKYFYIGHETGTDSLTMLAVIAIVLSLQH